MANLLGVICTVTMAIAMIAACVIMVAGIFIVVKEVADILYEDTDDG